MSEAQSVSSIPDEQLMSALDWPTSLQPLQDAYWEARRKWEETERAFVIAARFCLEHEENVVSAGKP